MPFTGLRKKYEKLKNEGKLLFFGSPQDNQLQKKSISLDQEQIEITKQVKNPEEVIDIPKDKVFISESKYIYNISKLASLIKSLHYINDYHNDENSGQLTGFTVVDFQKLLLFSEIKDAVLMVTGGQERLIELIKLSNEISQEFVFALKELAEALFRTKKTIPMVITGLVQLSCQDHLQN